MRKCFVGCVLCGHFHREIKLGLNKPVFGGDYLWQGILLFSITSFLDFVISWLGRWGNTRKVAKGFTQLAHFRASVIGKWFSLFPEFFFF